MNVQFDEENIVSRNLKVNSRKTGITDWLIQNGLAKNEAIAQYILIVVIIVCLVGAYILVFGSPFNNSSVESQAERIQRIQNSNLPPKIKERMLENN